MAHQTLAVNPCAKAITCCSLLSGLNMKPVGVLEAPSDSYWSQEHMGSPEIEIEWETERVYAGCVSLTCLAPGQRKK